MYPQPHNHLLKSSRSPLPDASNSSVFPHTSVLLPIKPRGNLHRLTSMNHGCFSHFSLRLLLWSFGLSLSLLQWFFSQCSNHFPSVPILPDMPGMLRKLLRASDVFCFCCLSTLSVLSSVILIFIAFSWQRNACFPMLRIVSWPIAEAAQTH